VARLRAAAAQPSNGSELESFKAALKGFAPGGYAPSAAASDVSAGGDQSRLRTAAGSILSKWFGAAGGAAAGPAVGGANSVAAPATSAPPSPRSRMMREALAGAAAMAMLDDGWSRGPSAAGSLAPSAGPSAPASRAPSPPRASAGGAAQLAV